MVWEVLVINLPIYQKQTYTAHDNPGDLLYGDRLSVQIMTETSHTEKVC